jgi:hypothetical protein
MLVINAVITASYIAARYRLKDWLLHLETNNGTVIHCSGCCSRFKAKR